MLRLRQVHQLSQLGKRVPDYNALSNTSAISDEEKAEMREEYGL